MKKIENKLKKNAKSLPSTPKEIVIPGKIKIPKSFYKNVFYKVAIATVSLGVCVGITASVWVQVNEKGGELSNNSFGSETTSTEQPNVSDTSSEIIVEPTPSEEPIIPEESTSLAEPTQSEETPSNEELPSNEQTTEEKPREPINFVPRQWPKVNDDLTFNYEDTYIQYQSDVFYKGVRYACTSGKNNGVDCWAIVTVGDNDEYIDCISILDTANDQRGIFNIYNDRIYYLQYPLNDDRDYILLNTLYIGSMNLLGEDKRIEKTVDIPFTHINLEISYLNSKYLFFAVTNVFDGVYDVMYRYNMETNELVNLNYKLGAHKTVYSIEDRVFVWSLDDDAIYEYDIDFKNEKLFYETGSIVHLAKNGFILESSETGNKRFLDLNGNVS